MVTKKNRRKKILNYPQKTDIGKTIGKLRTHKDTKLSIKAKTIVKKWKDDVVRQTDNTPTNRPPSLINISSPSLKKTSPVSSQASSPKTPIMEGPPRTVKTDEVSFKSTGNVPRNKTIELMYAAIGFGSGAGKMRNYRFILDLTFVSQTLIYC